MDWCVIFKVKEVVDIFVIVNGDIVDIVMVKEVLC